MTEGEPRALLHPLYEIAGDEIIQGRKPNQILIRLNLLQINERAGSQKDVNIYLSFDREAASEMFQRLSQEVLKKEGDDGA